MCNCKWWAKYYTLHFSFYVLFLCNVKYSMTWCKTRTQTKHTLCSVLQVLTFERGNISSFPSPKRGSTDVLSKSRIFFPYFELIILKYAVHTTVILNSLHISSLNLSWHCRLLLDGWWITVASFGTGCESWWPSLGHVCCSWGKVSSHSADTLSRCVLSN
jgi:hypothetical protein